MDQPMTKEESYADRRKLFKDIWETTMDIDNTNNEFKPKVIKTLRLDELDRSLAGKRKKQRIKNLRAVCKKLIDFCDQQDADDLHYGQIAAEDTADGKNLTKIKKRYKHKSKLRKPNTIKVSIEPYRQDSTGSIGGKTSRNTSPIKIKRACRTYNKRTNFIPKPKIISEEPSLKRQRRPSITE